MREAVAVEVGPSRVTARPALRPWTCALPRRRRPRPAARTRQSPRRSAGSGSPRLATSPAPVTLRLRAHALTLCEPRDPSQREKSPSDCGKRLIGLGSSLVAPLGRGTGRFGKALDADRRGQVRGAVDVDGSGEEAQPAPLEAQRRQERAQSRLSVAVQRPIATVEPSRRRAGASSPPTSERREKTTPLITAASSAPRARRRAR